MKLPNPPFLYPVFDAAFSRNLVGDASEAIRAGIGIFQIRMKHETKKNAWQTVSQLAPLCKESNVCMVVNDYVDVVLASDACGVHLGQQDFPASEARKILGSRIIGLSTHNRTQFENACDLPVDYVAVGPIFRTESKEDAGEPLGIDRLKEMIAVKRKPVVCIGGIDETNIRRLVDVGVDGIAVISALYRTFRIYDTVSYLRDMIVES